MVDSSYTSSCDSISSVLCNYSDMYLLVSHRVTYLHCTLYTDTFSSLSNCTYVYTYVYILMQVHPYLYIYVRTYIWLQYVFSTLINTVYTYILLAQELVIYICIYTF